jgi:hypothetical protein
MKLLVVSDHFKHEVRRTNAYLYKFYSIFRLINFVDIGNLMNILYNVSVEFHGNLNS